jgi:RND family efflux transporter MFP subunit
MRKLGKFITGLVIVGAIGGGWYYYKGKTAASTTAKKYIVGTATIGTVISTVEGSGQVESVDEAIVKPNVGGDVTSLKAKVGQPVKAGAVLFTIDDTDARKTVRDAQASLASAQLSYQRATEAATDLELLRAENSLTNAKESQQNAEDKLTKSVADGYDAVANGFLDLPTIMSGMQDMLRGIDAQNDKSQWNIDYYTDMTRRYDESVTVFRDDLDKKYDAARKAYDANLELYKATDRAAGQTEVINLIGRSYETSLLIDKMVKSADNLIQFHKDTMVNRGLTAAPFTSKHLTALDSYERTLTSLISSLNSARTTIQSSAESVTSSERTIREQAASLAELKAGPNKLDVESAKLSLASAQNKLADARAALKDYTVTAPMEGMVVKVNVEKGERAASGSEAITITTVNKVATVSLAEVDAAKAKVGQTATLTFDAVSDLEMTGKVVEVDAIGTASQGVVTYSAKISMDTQDDRIKPGMSVTAVIATSTRIDVVTVANAAIKKSGTQSYVEKAPAGAVDGATVEAEPNSFEKAEVTLGLVGSDSTEITGGLAEGDLIIMRSTTATTTNTSGNNRTGGAFLMGGPGR